MDLIYQKHRVETEPAVMERGLRFLQWLMARCGPAHPARRISVLPLWEASAGGCASWQYFFLGYRGMASGLTHARSSRQLIATWHVLVPGGYQHAGWVAGTGHRSGALSRCRCRPESRIAVVTHCGFLFLTLSAFGHDCAQPVQARGPWPPTVCMVPSLHACALPPCLSFPVLLELPVLPALQALLLPATVL